MVVIAEEYDWKSFARQDTVRTFRLANQRQGGISVFLTNFGPTVVRILGVDDKGQLEDLLLGYSTVEGYQEDSSYQGRIAVGRVANRIGNAAYNDPHSRERVRLPANDGPHTLHGGPKGWSSQTWDVDSYAQGSTSAAIRFSYHCNHMEDGFPGDVVAWVTVELTKDNELRFSYILNNEQDPFCPTPVNLTFHGYFNLNGGNTTIHNHFLRTNADRVLPVQDLIPTGAIAAVGPIEYGRYDFRDGREIGDEKWFKGQGYDNCLVFPDGEQGKAELWSPSTGRRVTMTTDQPAVQLYTGFFLEAPFRQFQGVCLEPQQLVDAVNHPEWWDRFGNPFVEPGAVYSHTTTYKFEVKK